MYGNSELDCTHIYIEHDLLFYTEMHSVIYKSAIIGGHGFWGRGGVYTGGVSKKFRRRLRRRRHRGVEIFFQGVILLVDPGVILPKIVKLGVPSGPPGATLPCLRQGGVSGNFRS